MRLRQWIWLLGLGLACDDRPLVMVAVAPLPADAVRLLASLTYHGKPARSAAPLDFDLTDQDLTRPATFGVRMPAHTDGDLVVGAGAINRDGCLSAFGSGAVASISIQPQVDVRLQSALLSTLTHDERCTQPASTPLLLSVSPALASSAGGSRVTLRGWGFTVDDCPLVSFSGQSASEVLCASLVELSATVPPSHGALGPVPVQVLNRNGRSAVSTALFSYYAETIRLGEPVTLPLGMAPSALAAGFVDADKRPDLVVANRDGASVSVLLNDGQGRFPAGFSANFAVGVSPSAVAIGDVDGDGVADVVATNASAQTVSVLLQQRPAVPAVFSPALTTFVNLLPSALVLADINSDGALDAVVANALSSDVSVLLNVGMGRLAKSAQRDYAVPREPTSVAVADLNHDGAPDLVVGSAQAAVLTVLQNYGGDFSVAARRSVSVEDTITALLTADMDGNGAPDVVAALRNGRVAVLWNDGTGHFDGAATSSIPVASGLTALAAGDLDRDGRLDIVVTTASEQRLYILRNTQTRSGQRGLAPLPGGYAVGSHPVAVSVADFNGDGLPDVAVANQGASSISVLLNQSN